MNTSHGVIQGYDGVAMVDDRYQVIVHAEAFGEAQEQELLEPMMEGTRENLKAIGKQAHVFERAKLTADSGFHSENNVRMLMEEGIDAYVADHQFRTHEGFAIANLRIGPWKPYVTAGLLVPACFVMIYAVTWLTGLGQPDWKLEQLMATIGVSAGIGHTPMPAPFFVLPVLYVVTLIISPFVNGVFGFAEELGWRGYLLPKLMALGNVNAYPLLGGFTGIVGIMVWLALGLWQMRRHK